MPEAIELRARVYRQIREYFQSRQVKEVETPLLSPAGNTDPNIESLTTSDPCSYLQTSPEFAMKRLIASGSGSIYQICKAFRKGESGRRHRTEFTLLEWYRVAFDYHQLMADVVALLQQFLGGRTIVKVSYRQLFQDYLGFDPHQIKKTKLADIAHSEAGYRVDDADSKDMLLELLMSHLIEPKLAPDALTFVYDYPASQCALAQVVTDDSGNAVARRFELYSGGIELANGYQELTDWQEQQRRFIEENRKRKMKGLPVIVPDNQLINALQHGLPQCSGVALGIDRLLMLMLKADNIDLVVF